MAAKVSDAQVERPSVDEKDYALAIAPGQPSDEEVDAFINDMEAELAAKGGLSKGWFDLEFNDPKYFTWIIVVFASMGGLLSGLDQSTISGANLYLPKDLGLTTRQNSLVNSAMPLGAVGGAMILSPSNEWFGRRWSIIISCILYTVGAALEAGAVNYGELTLVSFSPVAFPLSSAYL
jgi:hypothetical protein